MALMTCPECKREVSDQAVTCPGCGYPLQVVNPLAMEGERRQAQASLVELTAKRLKKHYAIAGFVCIVGMLLTCATCVRANINNGPFWPVWGFIGLLVAGLLYMMAIQVLIWWHHR